MSAENRVALEEVFNFFFHFASHSDIYALPLAT